MRINPGLTGVVADCAACAPDFAALLAASPQLSAAWSALPRRTLQPGQFLLQTGEQARHVWRIERGLLRICFLSQEGRESNRSFHAEGQWVGAGAPPAENASPYAIQALEDCVLAEVSYPALRTLLATHQQLGATMQNALVQILLQQDLRMAELLQMDATDRYLSFLGHYGAMADRIHLHHVASYLGITNVALSRIRKRLKGQQD